MKTHRSFDQLLATLRAEPDPEDGRRPPRHRSGGGAPDAIPLRRLCGQIARVAQAALGAADDPALTALIVIRVEPLPEPGVVEIVVAPGDTSEPPPDLPTRLHRAVGHIRSEVATALPRKRVPRLKIRLDPGVEG